MINEKINIKFFSEAIEEYNLLVREFKNSYVSEINFNLLPLNNFIAGDNEIIIIKLNNIESEILKKLSENKKTINQVFLRNTRQA